MIGFSLDSLLGVEFYLRTSWRLNQVRQIRLIEIVSDAFTWYTMTTGSFMLLGFYLPMLGYVFGDERGIELMEEDAPIHKPPIQEIPPHTSSTTNVPSHIPPSSSHRVSQSLMSRLLDTINGLHHKFDQMSFELHQVS